jgi:predicted transcriptional regulator
MGIEASVCHIRRFSEGIAQADRGEFVPDEVVAKADKRHGV